jgi:hypothetical protein
MRVMEYFCIFHFYRDGVKSQKTVEMFLNSQHNLPPPPWLEYLPKNYGENMSPVSRVLCQPSFTDLFSGSGRSCLSSSKKLRIGAFI